MSYPTKIATCCYCGSRAALVLGKDRHELSCATCGAPLHDMKRLPKQKKTTRERAAKYAPEPQKRRRDKDFGYDVPKRKYRKKRKGMMRHLLEEAFDVIEDVFD